MVIDIGSGEDMAHEKGNVLLGLAAVEVGTNIGCDSLTGSRETRPKNEPGVRIHMTRRTFGRRGHS